MPIRKAGNTQADCKFVFSLSNDAVVRANSFSQGEIKYSDHCGRFEEILSVCLLVSGGLGLTALKNLCHKSDISLHSVLTDRKSEEIIGFCKDNGLPCFAGNPRGGVTAAFRRSLGKCPDIILSVNYLFLIEDDLISWPKKYAVNVHGSLLPRYRGRTPHVWAIINGEKEAGITAHLITKECDKGNIIARKVIPITRDDTGGSMLAKYRKSYPALIDEVISKIMSGEFETISQDESRATYYPKRTPDDGGIDWSWQRERIRNWVRAMAPPEYPGAFFYDSARKVIVEKAEHSDLGFPENCPDGKVICHDGNEYIIKVQDGCIKLFEYIPRENK